MSSWMYSIPDWNLWTITVFAVLISFVLYVQKRNSRFVALVNKLPGPKSVFFFGNVLPVVKVSKKDWFSAFNKILENYSHEPISRLWVFSKPAVFVNQAPAIENILNSNKLLDKATSYSLLHPWLGFGLLTSTGEKWRSRRKLITPSFHFRILDDFFKTFVEHSEVLIKILKTKEDQDYFDIYPYITRCALDIICETAMGKRIEAQSDTNSEYVRAVFDQGEIVSLRSMLPWLANEWMFSLTSLGRRQKSSLKILHGFTNQVIRERWAVLKANQNASKSPEMSDNDTKVIGQKRRLAFLDMLLENFRDSDKLNFEDIREEVDTFMFEGHDTTASSLIWLLYNVGRFPEIQQQLHQEVDSVFGNSDRSVCKEDLVQLKYLELVIKESMRIFPPVPFYGRQVMEDYELSGYLIPAGVEIGFTSYLVHRNEKYFPDPEKFDPDRFLPENCAKRHPFAYIRFSAGPRNCIGQKFAMMEIKTTACQILRNFKVTSKHRIDEIKLLSEFVLRPANGMWIKLESRLPQ